MTSASRSVQSHQLHQLPSAVDFQNRPCWGAASDEVLLGDAQALHLSWAMLYAAGKALDQQHQAACLAPENACQMHFQVRDGPLCLQQRLPPLAVRHWPARTLLAQLRTAQQRNQVLWEECVEGCGLHPSAGHMVLSALCLDAAGIHWER